MTEDLVIKNGLVVTPQGVIYGGVAVRHERILQIGADELLPKAKQEVDAEGAYVLPGIIDPHVHIGQTKEEGAVSAFRSESGGSDLRCDELHDLCPVCNALERRLQFTRDADRQEKQSFADFKIHAYLVSSPSRDRRSF
jgi:predicted amidohydrolase YtcJ